MHNTTAPTSHVEPATIDLQSCQQAALWLISAVADLHDAIQRECNVLRHARGALFDASVHYEPVYLAESKVPPRFDMLDVPGWAQFPSAFAAAWQMPQMIYQWWMGEGHKFQAGRALWTGSLVPDDWPEFRAAFLARFPDFNAQTIANRIEVEVGLLKASTTSPSDQGQNLPDRSSVPLTKTELARRITGNRDARPRNVDWDRYNFEVWKGSKGFISLRNCDARQIARIEAPIKKNT